MVDGMDHIVDVAYGFAACAHRNQKRKYTGQPYIVHPSTVAMHCKLAGLPDFVVAAAYLHDVVEDCGVTHEQIEHTFGGNVATLVYHVTDQYTSATHPTLNRARRKELERNRLGIFAPAYAQSIKVADLIDNTDSIVQHDPDFAKVYLKEKRALLEVLVHADPKLLNIARLQLEQS